ncbi:hypothetical protein ASPBRDRAFT_192949 [Aspergillus brasiliensis CBS 101740]|uniref:Uncharacterized protein n=1 Tax=Aspergillus brasiliensis (strain CBS 101740 / IMI 381727 / IBT 21946) TaxID=767769 RepID=A0A1L9URA4_ASPBC|nr:hypothetical protein ASPBRDRAFT_192949 [Aspergillus brasiliensis CBS 101740]
MSSTQKKVSFRTPLEEVISPAQGTRAKGRQDGSQDIRGATRSGYPYIGDVNPVQTSSYSSPYNPNDPTFWCDSGVNKYTALHSHPVHPLRIPRGYTRTQTTTLVRAGDTTITLSEPDSPPRASKSRNTPMPEVTEGARASERYPPRSSSLQPLCGLSAAIDSRGPHTTFDEIIPTVSHDGDRIANASARTTFSFRGMLQKTRGVEKSRMQAPTIESKSRSSSSGAGKTVFKDRKSRKNARNPATSLGAISAPTVVPTSSLLQQLGRKYIDLSPSQDTPAYQQQAVSRPMKPATPDTPSRHASPTSFATPSKNAMAGHHENKTTPPLAPSPRTEHRRPGNSATSDAGVQAEPSANGSAWTCAQFDALSDTVCRKVREAETNAQRDQYLQMALEVQKLIVDYQRMGEVVENTSKFLNQKIMEKESIETKLRAMMEES